MKRRICLLAIAQLIASGAAAQTAQVTSTPPDFPRGRISGVIFGDAYYNVTGDPGHSYNSSGADTAKANIDGSPFASGAPKLIGRDLNGFQLRRVYFQADNDLSVKYATRVRLEIDGKSLTSDGKIGVNVKGAYVMAKNVIPRGTFSFGVLTTPIFENTDEFWQYRSIEKSIADFRGIGSSADLGVGLKGYLDGAHRIGYSAMLGNGLGQKPEDNRYKKFYLLVPLRPTEDLRIEPYFDYEGAAGGKEKATFKVLVGYELKKASLGVEVLDRVNHASTGPNKEPFGISAFGRVLPHAKLAAFARYDRWQPDTRAANRIDSDLWIAGLDWEPYKDAHLMPNIEATQYRARGTAVAPSHHDLQARLTFYFKFSRP